MNKNSSNLLFNNILFGSIGLLFLIGACIAVGYFDFSQYMTKIVEQSNRNATIAATRFTTVMNDNYLVLKLLDKWIETNREHDPTNNPEFNSFIDVYREHTHKQIDVRMVTKEGGLFYFPAVDKKPKADVSDREYYKIHIDNKMDGTYFASPVLSRVTGRWGIPISYRVKTENPHIFILFSVIEFQILDNLFGGLSQNSDSAVVITKNGKEVLYRYPFIEERMGKTEKELVEYRKSIFGIEGTEIVKIKGNERRLLVHSEVEGFPIRVTISENYDKLIERWVVLFGYKLIIILVIIVLFVLLTLKTVRLTLRLQNQNRILTASQEMLKNANESLIEKSDSLEKKESELLISNSTKDRLLGIIGHDLRGPLGSAIYLLEDFEKQMENLPKKELYETVINIKEALKNIYELLINLLNWALLQRGEIAYLPEKIGIEQLIQEASSPLLTAAKVKNISFVINVQKDKGIIADKQMITTVIRNLISNAIKFTPANGKIEIENHENENNIQISIKDNGIGMDQKEREELFVVRESKSRKGTNNEKGTGLGLVLCKEFVERSGGKISVESEKGIGSTFTVELPKITK